MTSTFLKAVLTASVILLSAVSGGSGAVAASRQVPAARVTVSTPTRAHVGKPFVVTVHLPANAAAVDGRVLMAHNAATVWGVSPLRGGKILRPEAVTGGVAFGAYDLHSSGSETVLRIIMEPRRSGHLELRVVIDTVADANGNRLTTLNGSHIRTVGVGSSITRLAAPAPAWATTPLRAAGPTRDLFADGRISKQDLDAARVGWDLARLNGQPCQAVKDADANDDGCADISDLQVLSSSLGLNASATAAATLSGNFTFVVTSALDTADASPGDGLCADANGNCTLRAAMTESSWVTGNDRIEFNITGVAPVTIQLSSRLPNIGSRNGTLTIDGYTQPGSRVNTATVGSNAVPGIEIRGNGNAAREIGFYITSMGNTVRGMLIDNIYRGIFMDGSDAHDNRILGNWIGFTKLGTLSSKGTYGVLMNIGAHNNTIGTAALADSNLIGNYNTGIDNYGPGVNANVTKGNVLCLQPTGLLVGTCNTAIDHNFGPKNNIIGGTGPGERNVVGPTTLQALEFSHGWNPAGVHGATDPTYEISGNIASGNWFGFRGDGSYSASFRSGLNASSADNANAINIYDGSRNNTVQNNYVASVYDGVVLESTNSYGNVVRNNTIGVSPLGQAAPLTRWGVVVRLQTNDDSVIGNTIRNAASGGIGLLNVVNSGATAAVSRRILISQNIVTDTNGPAIFLAPDPNDPGSTANNGILKPVISSATPTRISGTGIPGGTVEVYRASRPMGQAGLPTAYLGSASIASDGTWSVALSELMGVRITALQIDPNNNTSELTLNVTVGTAAPPPQPGDLLAGDAFGRSVSNGWGTADTGGTWSLIGSVTAFSVANGVGTISTDAGLSREARLNISAADVNITGTVALDRLPGSGNAFAYVVARTAATSNYRTTIRIASTGEVYVKLTKVIDNSASDVAAEVATGVTTAANSPLAYRLRIVGSHLQFRVWNAAASEPSAWQTEADETTPALQVAGGVGLRSYTNAGIPNGPIAISFDAYEVRVP